MKKLTSIILIGAALFCFAIPFACVDHSETPPATDTVQNLEHENPNWFCRALEIKHRQKPQPRAVGAKGKTWPLGSTLRIGFLDQDAAGIVRVKAVCAEWTRYANVKLDFPPAGPYDIRIAFNPGGGAWSYIGTDCKLVPQSSPTMNLGFSGTNSAGLDYVALHEFGHSLSLLHEQQNPVSGICFNEANVIAALSGPPNNWSLSTIRFNVLDKYNPANVNATAFDGASVMEYQLPGSWICSGVGIPGGKALSNQDKTFISFLYPGTFTPPTPTLTVTQAQRDNIVRLQGKARLYQDSAIIITKTAFQL